MLEDLVKKVKFEVRFCRVRNKERIGLWCNILSFLAMLIVPVIVLYLSRGNVI